MDDGLLDSVMARLELVPLGEVEEALLLQALSGDEAGADDGSNDAGSAPPVTSHGVETTGRQRNGAGDTPAGAYLASVTVAGFRGIGPAATLKVEPGPGLTVVCGRNGSGKSSFAEALEVLVTGSVGRMTGRSAVWQGSWRCLHGGEPEITAEVLVEGSPGATVLRRTWDPAAKKVEDGLTSVQRPGQARTNGDGLGWRGALGTQRPFLSHAELESLLAEPKDLYDQLNRLLGLDDVEDGLERLARQRKAADDTVKASKRAGVELQGDLDGSDDPRSAAVARLLKARALDIDGLEALATGTADIDRGPVGILDALAHLTIPSSAMVVAALDELRRAVDELAEMQASTSGAATATTELVEAALACTLDNDDCPVCGTAGVLDDAWRERTELTLADLRASTVGLRHAQGRADQAWSDARALVTAPPAALFDAGGFGGDVAVRAAEVSAAWRAWAREPLGDGIGARRAFADNLGRTQPGLEAAVTGLIAVAADRHGELQDRWAPLARRLSEWCGSARPAAKAKVRWAEVKRAEDWLKAATDDLRNDRLRPFADRTVDLWRQLRQSSNVDLVEVRLAGAANRSHVEFRVDVDGQSAHGLGVMSQGEVNALALSVFLPRATMPGSPFGFVVIDDPVQAMDPSKVDGLARVLCEAAANRQVIVFTHDDRLPESLRRLDLPVTILQVHRRPGSIVGVVVADDPCHAILRDAQAVIRDPAVPPMVAKRVVPGLCRSAIETVCTELARSRRLRAGAGHSEVDDLLSSVNRTIEWVALGVLDDQNKGGEVNAWLTKRVGGWATGVLKNCQAGSHEGGAGDVSRLVDDTRRLVRSLRAVAP